MIWKAGHLKMGLWKSFPRPHKQSTGNLTKAAKRQRKWEWRKRGDCGI